MVDHMRLVARSKGFKIQNTDDGKAYIDFYGLKLTEPMSETEAEEVYAQIGLALYLNLELPIKFKDSNPDNVIAGPWGK